MRKSATLIAIALVALLALAACGGGPSTTSTATPAPSPTVAEPSPTPSPAPTPFPQEPVQPAVTPALSPDEAIHTLCLTVEQFYPQIEGEPSEPIAEPITETVGRILTGLGLEVVAEATRCDATLTFALTGEPLGAGYRGFSDYCYTGAEVEGEMTLAIPDRAPLTLPISGREPTSLTTTWCRDETDAPFDEVWPIAVLEGLAQLWGIQALIQAQEYEDKEVRGAAAEVLGKIGPEAVEAPPALIQALKDEEPSVRNAAQEALEKIGPGAIPALVQALEDKDEDVRKSAAWVLSKIGPEARDAVPALIQTLQDEEPSVRDYAAWALGKIGPEAKEAVPALIQALQDENENVREGASEALEAISGKDFGDDAVRWQQWWEEQQ